MYNLLPQLKRSAPSKGAFNVADCRTHQCKVCPLALEPNVFLDMPPSGADKPLAYILAEAPGREELREGVQLIGESGQLFRSMIPRKYRDLIRYNNVAKCWPYKNATPTPQTVECCHPRTVSDIERTKPKAIIGLGGIALSWAMPQGAEFAVVNLWRGRRMPIRVGTHTCWYYPLFHPAFLLRKGRFGTSTLEHITRLDMKRIFAEIDSIPNAPQIPEPEQVFENIDLITDFGVKGLDRIKAWFSWANEQSEIGLDFETDQLRPYSREVRLLTVSIATADSGFAFGIDHPDCTWGALDRERVCALFVEFLRGYKGRIYVHNLAFELEWLGVYFGDVSLVRDANWHDTMSQAAVIDERRGETKPGAFSLAFLVQNYFGFNLKKLTNLDRAALADEPLDLVLFYNGGDARYHCKLGIEQDAIIRAEGLQEVYRLALRRVPTIVLTQIKGVPVDQSEVKNLQAKYEDRLKTLYNEIMGLEIVREFAKIRGTEFVPLSPRDVLYVFKDMLNAAECEIYDKKKKSSRYSVDKKILDTIDHPLARLIVDYRETTKRLSTYIIPLIPGHRDSVLFDDGLIHTSFNTVFAETGRLSSDSPNMQNFPKRDGEAKELRKQVSAAPGCLAVALDYGQIEARVIAMVTKDKLFVKMLWEDYDIHMEWAERVAYAYPAKIGGLKFIKDKATMKTLRTDIKNQWTFPLFFGASVRSVSGYLGIPEEIIEPLYDEFWKQFHAARDWQEETKAFYNDCGYVECLTGRRRHGPMTVNQLINAPIQGTAAEIVMDAMSRLSETGNAELQPELNIHDDLTYLRIPIKRADELCEQIVDKMIHVPFGWAKIVPITVEMSVGTNWMPWDAVSNPEGLKEGETFRSDKW